MANNVSFDIVAPHILILASRYDLACDYVVSHLRKNSIQYLRLNSEDLNGCKVYLDPLNKSLSINLADNDYLICPSTLKSLFYRRPVFLRDYGGDSRTPQERFSRLQWSNFMRNLMLFDEALWINNPVATYYAEHKAIQLSVAKQIGFYVPETIVTNAPKTGALGIEFGRQVAIKGLDTVLLRDNNSEMFGYTTFEDAAGLEKYNWSIAPAIIQNALRNKIDIRVTIVGEKVFAAAITKKGLPIEGDWRKFKNDVQFTEYNLPKAVEQNCCQLLKALGLYFGCVDLALQENKYYFFEVNPTGEWAWLVDAVGLPIDCAIANALIRGN